MLLLASMFLLVVVLLLVLGSVQDPNFWSNPDQRGDALFRAGKFAEAAKLYTDPWRVGVAQYRNGDFEAAAKTFARVPGAEGAFNQGNAWLMQGKYDDAIASYDRALGFRSGWKAAEENKALAVARRDKINGFNENATLEPPEEEPDEIVFDQKGENRKGQPQEISDANMSDEQLRATWLRRVQTTPGDFLKAKFAYQAAHLEQKDAKKAKVNRPRPSCSFLVLGPGVLRFEHEGGERRGSSSPR
jgi:Ca-activated chloride channel family protein